jgi:hypothetical protein
VDGKYKDRRKGNEAEAIMSGKNKQKNEDIPHPLDFKTEPHTKTLFLYSRA